MIYEFGRNIIFYCKCIRHLFRAMFCKSFYRESHGVGMCGHDDTKVCCCEYWYCPRMKGADDDYKP